MTSTGKSSHIWKAVTSRSLETAAVRRSLAFGGSRRSDKHEVCVRRFQESDVLSRVSSVQKENNRVPPPWGDDMEEALMAQAEAIRKKAKSGRRRRWLSWCRSTTVPGLWLIIAIILVWFLLAFAMRHSHAAGLRAILTDVDRSAR
jgi:hypothetical protein